MAYDEHLADRVRTYLRQQGVRHEEKKMMGGLCFMLEGKMLAGIVNERLMARVGEEASNEALQKHGVHEMDFTGKPLKGYIFVEDTALDMDVDLAYWLDLCLAFNPKAKASSKRAKKKD
jgi:TfoX/Sxy family transcriptional regulator of competence genes